LYRLLPYSLAKELSVARYIPSMILVQLAQHLSVWYRSGKVDVILFQTMDTNLNHLSDIQGGGERIMTTPILYAYSVLIHRTTCIVFYYPWGWWTVGVLHQ
jgi:ion channel-forming bestrophin family protein